MQKLDDRLEHLLNRFEAETRPYDKLSTLAVIMTPVAVIAAVLLGWLLVPSLQESALRFLVAGDKLYWVIGGILGSLAATRLVILYADRKKHQISDCKYKPLSGGKCMCDLSQLRYHMLRLEKSKHEGERIRHAKMISYYKERLALA